MGLLAVLGGDVSRSLSPLIHEAASRAMGFRFAYLAVSAADANDFERKVEALRVLGALGANVTIPFKRKAKTLCGVCSEVATSIGVVNTMIFRPDGVIEGDNTDGPGLLSDFSQRPANQLRVVRILGAGGAARAVAWAAREVGAGVIEVAARRAEEARSVAEPFGARATSLDAGEPPTLVVSTLPNDPQIAEDAVQRWFDTRLQPAVLDLAYNEPDAPPPLVRIARSVGLDAQDGLGLLVEQGALSFCRWTGADLASVRQAMSNALLGVG
ncbi:MAG: hypothetical protein KTR25_05260 [Myxococcales bacterium]|nr:hypothetical protein [Myxococcales bacterium]